MWAADAAGSSTLPSAGRNGLAYGGDYNPEQWPREVWQEDVRLMGEAGVNLVTVGVFSWAAYEPAPGRYDFGWLDAVMDLCADYGIRVELATPTAAPPPWFFRRYPEALLMTEDGQLLGPGGRQGFCPSSPAYRQRALVIAEELARRYRDHPALALWHVHNEYGCHNARCYCDTSATAFRRWLRARYGDLDELNAAWGTYFWGQQYGAWEEIVPPRRAAAFRNPTQQLDFRRFSSDELLECFRAERDVLRRTSPNVPVTTNFMVAKSAGLDYWKWAADVDVVSNDHYLVSADPRREVDLAMSADLSRSLAAGRPWLLQEHSTSAVNWQPRNRAKRPGEMLRNSLAHVARGADGVCFFQWRASAAGAEKFHSAMVPHAGTDTKVWREVVELGDALRRLGPVAGSRVRARVAICFDWEAWWACELDSHPSVDVGYLDRVRAHYEALWGHDVTVDFVHPEADLSPYRLVLAPTLYLVSDAAADNIRRYVAAGGHFLATYFSGIVDTRDHVRLGGYPGAFRDVLGIVVEELFPLQAGERVRLSPDEGHPGWTSDTWTELLHLHGAEAVARYADGPLPDVPAVTRHRYGDGVAWYAATRLDAAATAALAARMTAEAEVAPAAAVPDGVEVVRRVADPRARAEPHEGDDRLDQGTAPDSEAPVAYLFAVNHTGATVNLPARGTELLTGKPVEGDVELAAGAVAVIEER